MSIPTKAANVPPPSTIEDVLMRGDLSGLTQQQRLEYYNRVCSSVGLNPLTRPFEYLVLNNKLQLYARRDAADQLRKLHGISIEVVSQEFKNGLYTVHVRARDKDGRNDEDLGVVSFSENLKGDVAANTILKAVTKAKRRVTLSICGLGFLDETEVADIPSAKPIDPPEHDPQTGEIEYPEVRPIPSIDSEPDKFHSWLNSQLIACNDEESVKAVWQMVESQVANTFPPDQKEIHQKFNARKKALKEKHAES